MSTTFKAQSGDTFESISRKAYGDDQYADVIRSANPGLAEPMVGGEDVTAPPRSGSTRAAGTYEAQSDEDIAVLINGQRFRFWETVEITRSLDTVDTFSLVAPFEEERQEFRAAFRPFSFAETVVQVASETLFTGVMVPVRPILETNRKTVQVSGYSRPGVLQDCTASPAAYPIEFNGFNIGQIAKSLCRPFGLDVVGETQGPTFGRVAASSGQAIFGFLSTIARQRSSVLGSTPEGDLEIRKPTGEGTAVAVLEQGAPPLTAVSPQFNEQEFYSDVTGIGPTLVGLPGPVYTHRNKLLRGVFRPHVFEATDVTDADLSQSVLAKAGRMYANMLSYTASVNTWRAPNGAMWAPGDIIKLKAPDAMIYDFYRFEVRSVTFRKEGTATTATLLLTIPGSLAGVIPEALPWDE